MINFFQRTFIYLFFVYQLSLKLSATTVIYEKLSYKPIIITNKTLKKNISFSFSAFNRTFSIRLWPVINHNASLTKNSTKTPLTNMYWEGKLLNDSLSEVNGYIKNKFFEGKIKTVNSTFFVDDITKHQDIKKNKKNSHVHSVIYYKNVSAPKDNNSTLEEIDVLSKLKKHVIKKRNSFLRVHPVRTCEVYILADNRFFLMYSVRNNVSTFLDQEKQIIRLINEYIDFTNELLSNHSFEGVMGINLKLAKLKYYEQKICMEPKPEYKFCEPLSYTDYLKYFINESRQNYCLALILTNTNLLPLDEILPSDIEPDKIHTMCAPEGVSKSGEVWSLNAAALNFFYPMKKLAQKLYFAHLIGHSLGADHDTSASCENFPPEHNYLMSEMKELTGENPNNFKFSNCSIKKIASFLKHMLKFAPGEKLASYMSDNISRNCLIEDQTKDFCGNQIVGPEEECDCGFSQEECELNGDKCCQFPDSTSSELSCKFKENEICNPLKDACCNPKTCESFLITDKKICNKSFECHQASICSGLKSCPKNIPVLDYTPCQNNTKICFNGKCVSNSLLTKSKVSYKKIKNNYLLIFGVILIITAIGLGLFYFYKKELNLNKI